MKPLHKMFLLVLAVALLLVACSEEGATEKKEETDGGKTAVASEQPEEATVSGNLEFYTSQPDTDVTELVKRFNGKYPDVKVKVFRSGTEEVVGKILAEKEAGAVQADVLLVADSVTFENLKEQDLLASYESKELADIPEQFVDPDFTYAGTKVMATVLAVNTNNAQELPSSWKVLSGADSGKEAIMPSPLYSGAAAYNVGVFTRQEAFGWDYFKQLKTNDMMVVQGNGAALKSVTAGEKTYAMVVDFIVARAKAEGSPVELVYPEEGVPVITEPIGMMKGAKNEAAAKAFIDFVLSEEGQRVAAEIGYTPIREGVAAPEGLRTITEMNVLSAPIDEMLKTREEDKRQFKELFGE